MPVIPLFVVVKVANLAIAEVGCQIWPYIFENLGIELDPKCEECLFFLINDAKFWL